jgi:hypothetical protein
MNFTQYLKQHVRNYSSYFWSSPQSSNIKAIACIIGMLEILTLEQIVSGDFNDNAS